jgi:hypothetical protein
MFLSTLAKWICIGGLATEETEIWLGRAWGKSGKWAETRETKRLRNCPDMSSVHQHMIAPLQNVGTIKERKN